VHFSKQYLSLTLAWPMLLLQISLLLAAYSTNAQIAYVLLMLVACSNPPFISNKENLTPYPPQQK
jgi:bacteriorhodopsin